MLNFILKNMERKIGEEFEFIGYVLKVEKAADKCEGCFLNQHKLACYHEEILSFTGKCEPFHRSDNQQVIFAIVM